MSSIVPVLDTTDFDALVEDAGAQIPRHAPGWTDHNAHDPGITIVELLAWIVDQQVYRVGFVGDRHLRAFAELLGARPTGPVEARGLVWPDRALDVGRSLAAGAAVVSTLRSDVPFELDEATHLTSARLTDILVVAAAEELVGRNEGERTPEFLVGPIVDGEPTELVLRFDRPLAATVPATVSIGFEVGAVWGAPADPESRRGPLSVRYRQTDSVWLDAPIVSDGTGALATTGVLKVAIPEGGPEPTPSELRISLDRGFFPAAPLVQRVDVNVLSIVQRETVPAGLVGTGRGLPDQLVEFPTDDLVGDGALDVLVDETPWIAVADFRDSGPADQHYVRRAGGLVFGNGVNGRRPDPGAQIHHGGVVRTLGPHGNLRAGLSWRVPALGDAVDPYGANPQPIAGGRAASALGDLLAAAQRTATRRRVLLTDDDLRVAALELPGFAVARAEVLDGFHPDAPDLTFDGTRTLIIIPERELDAPPVVASDAYLAEVRRSLADRRVLADRLFVTGHGPVALEVALAVTARPGSDPDLVASTIASRLRARLSDIVRMDGVAPWPMGRTVTSEELSAVAAQSDGVVAVTSCRLARRGQPLATDPIDIARDEVAVVDDARLDVRVEPT